MAKLIDRQGLPQMPLYVDYGQRTRDLELAACKEVLQVSRLPVPMYIDIRGFGQSIHSGLTDTTRDFRTEAFVPGRNLLLLTLAAAVAHANNSSQIAIGLLAESATAFPDQTEKFIVNANFAINSALDTDFAILTPLSSFSKGDVIRLAQKLKLPIGKTYSCHSGERIYCRECVACKDIIASGSSKLFPQFQRRQA